MRALATTTGKPIVEKTSPPLNPYESPDAKTTVFGPGPRYLVASVLTVLVTALIGGMIGLGIGLTLGSLTPGYYRSVFSNGSQPGFDPLAVGIGQGLTQGVGGGTLIGLAIIALFYWYRSRVAKTHGSNVNV